MSKARRSDHADAAADQAVREAKAEPGAPGTMKIETVAIDSISLDPANVRRHPDRNLEAIKGSLRRFKQQKPIVVDADGVIRAGNGTYEAARALGWEKIAIVRTGLKGSEATAYGLVDNRSAELAEWDHEGLGELIRGLRADEFPIAELGWEDDDLAAMLAAAPGPEPVVPPEDFKEFDESIPTDHQCPKCGYAWSGKSA